MLAILDDFKTGIINIFLMHNIPLLNNLPLNYSIFF